MRRRFTELLTLFERDMAKMNSAPTIAFGQKHENRKWQFALIKLLN